MFLNTCLFLRWVLILGGLIGDILRVNFHSTSAIKYILFILGIHLVCFWGVRVAFLNSCMFLGWEFILGGLVGDILGVNFLFVCSFRPLKLDCLT